MTARALLLILPLLLIGCGSDDDETSYEIATGNLNGKIGGKAWSLVSATTNTFLSNDSKFWVDLYATAEDCSGGITEGNSVILNVPRRVGDYKLSLSQNGTFVIDEAGRLNNLIATKGRLRVDEITTTLVRAGVALEYDNNNSINGQFEATICSD